VIKGAGDVVFEVPYRENLLSVDGHVHTYRAHLGLSS
jgi:hypothetical protein